MGGKKLLLSAVSAGSVLLGAMAVAQEQVPSHLKELLELGMHPGHAYVDEGREIFNTLKGPNGKTCASCHGEFDKWSGRYRVPLASFVASLSNGMEINVQLDDPQEKELYKKGEKLWFMRVGARDFSCGICHSVLAGKRIRLQGLPDPVKAKVYTHWPAYRFGSDKMWTMEDRVRSCFKAYFLYEEKWDEKKDWVKKPPPYSEWVIALELYMKYAANGGIIEVPGLLR